MGRMIVITEVRVKRSCKYSCSNSDNVALPSTKRLSSCDDDIIACSISTGAAATASDCPYDNNTGETVSGCNNNNHNNNHRKHYHCSHNLQAQHNNYDDDVVVVTNHGHQDDVSLSPINAEACCPS